MVTDLNTDPADRTEAGFSPLHPHEPDVPPTLDDEGRCLVCRHMVLAEGQGFSAGFERARREPLWLLMGDLDGLESDIAQYIRARGQHLPGVRPDSIAGVPVATANMAMSVIRRNVRRFGMGRSDG